MTGAADKPGTLLARIQAPRSLWDPTYTEQSWITNSNGHQPIRLLPDMTERVEKHYPKTKLSISEYDFGGRKTISGALAQADALGIFGRFGLFAACHWGLNHDDHAAFAGFEAFSNYDRAGSKFGDLELPVSGENPELNSVYASLDSKIPGRLTLVVINKSPKSQSMHVILQGVQPIRITGFVIKEDAYDAPLLPKAAMVVLDGVRYTAPPLSITTFEVNCR